MRIRNLTTHFLVLLATILVAGSFLASEKLVNSTNPFSLTLLRFLGAALTLSPFALYTESRRRSVFTIMPRALVISFFYSAFFIGLFWSLETTTPLNAGTLFTLVPIITLALSALILREKVLPKQLSIYLVGALGTIWVIFDGDPKKIFLLSLGQGELIFIVAVFFMCCYSIAMKLLYKNDDMTVLVFCILVGGSIWMALFIFFTRSPLNWHVIQGDLFLYMLYLVVGATLVTVYLYQKTTIILGPSRVNAYIYLNPALIAMLLFIFENKSIEPKIMPGILLSAFSTILLQKLNTTDRLSIK